MPTTSASHYGFMQAVRSGHARGKDLPSKAVAEEFIHETPPGDRKRFARTLARRRKRRKRIIGD